MEGLIPRKVNNIEETKEMACLSLLVYKMQQDIVFI